MWSSRMGTLDCSMRSCGGGLSWILIHIIVTLNQTCEVWWQSTTLVSSFSVLAFWTCFSWSDVVFFRSGFKCPSGWHHLYSFEVLVLYTTSILPCTEAKHCIFTPLLRFSNFKVTLVTLQITCSSRATFFTWPNTDIFQVALIVFHSSLSDTVILLHHWSSSR